MSAKDLLEYTFDELVDLTTREAHTGLLEGGGKGFRSSLSYYLEFTVRWARDKEKQRADFVQERQAARSSDRIDALEAENLELKRQLALLRTEQVSQTTVPVSLAMTSDDIEHVRQMSCHDGWMETARQAWNLAIERVCSSGATFARVASHKALILYFLNELSDRFDTDGCNDWELPDDLKPHKAELDLMLKQYSQRDEDEFEEDEDEDADSTGRSVYFNIRVIGALIRSVADTPNYLSCAREVE